MGMGFEIKIKMLLMDSDLPLEVQHLHYASSFLHFHGNSASFFFHLAYSPHGHPTKSVSIFRGIRRVPVISIFIHVQLTSKYCSLGDETRVLQYNNNKNKN